MTCSYHPRDAADFAEFVRVAAKFGLIVRGEPREFYWHKVRRWRQTNVLSRDSVEKD